MDIKVLVETLVLLNSHNPADCEGDLNVLCDVNVRLICQRYNIDPETITQSNKNLKKFNNHDHSATWKYICLNFHFLNLLQYSLDTTDDVLSVQQTTLVKNVFKNVIAIGIRCNLQPQMPGYRKLPTQYLEDFEPVLNSYNRLAATTYELIRYLQCIKLRNVILSESFKVILCSLYQIIYCPLKKPDENHSEKTGVFVMTPELYDRFVKEKALFKGELDHLEKSLWRGLYVKETMLLPSENKSPPWFTRAVGQNLNSVLCSAKGIETVACAMLDSSIDYDPNDKAKNWKIFDVIAKLIVNFYGKSEFETAICQQLIALFESNDRGEQYIVPFESLYILCVKKLFCLDKTACERLLLPTLLSQIAVFTDKDHKFSDGENVTDSVIRTIRILYSCFVEDRADNLPIELLTPSMPVIVSLYTMLSHPLQDELGQILIEYLTRQDSNTQFFDLFLFDIYTQEMDAMRTDIYFENDNGDLIVKASDFKKCSGVNAKGETLFKLCKTSTALSVDLFMYLLNVLIEHYQFLKISNRRDLLESGDEFVLDDSLQRKIIVYQLLYQLADDSSIQNHLKENPIDLIRYLKDILEKALDLGIHKTYDSDSDNFQTIFTLAMVLQALILNSENRNHFKVLLDILRRLFRESINLEFRNLLKGIIDLLIGKETNEKEKKSETKSELDKAIDDVCDSLLPIRGHGLMTLTKLIENKDPEILQRKNYILNILQQNLKDEDSFIYLSAISGLAAMTNVFTDTVLNILSDEYLDFSRKNNEDGVELRMKLGEIFVRVTKSLGEMAPTYKSLLLNTFLIGAKDDNYLIRASSLSNLGEVCRILGYKLGTIVTEVLACVHGVITTDKAPEARRAAVTVIRQLLAGLEVEMVTFLKDHILEVYRTLRMIYREDKDDVMRLHAQLALEELNENVKNFLLDGSQLKMEKKSVLPDCS